MSAAELDAILVDLEVSIRELSLLTGRTRRAIEKWRKADRVLDPAVVLLLRLLQKNPRLMKEARSIAGLI